MGELVIPPSDISKEVRRYGTTLLKFASHTDFPEGLLSYPDYVMIKTSTPADFDKKVKSIKTWAEKAAFMEIDSRFLVAAHLAVPMTLSDYRTVDWVEIMEAKTPDSPTDYEGVEYAEFYHNDFHGAGLIMQKNKVDFEKREDGKHRWWNIRINEEGQEVRISDKPLSEIVDRELDDGTARFLQVAA